MPKKDSKISVDEIENASKSLRELRAKIKELKKEFDNSINASEDQLQSLVKQISALEKQERGLKRIQTIQNRINQEANNFDELLTSVGNKLGTQSKAYEKIQNAQERVIDNLKETASISSELVSGNNRLRTQSEQAAKQYAAMETSIASAQAKFEKGNITMEQLSSIISTNVEGYQSFIDSIDTSTEAGRKLYEQFKKIGEQQRKNNKEAKETAKGVEKIKDILGPRVTKGLQSIFGKKFESKLAGFIGKSKAGAGAGAGGGFGAGMMGKALGGLGTMAGSLVRLAGPIGAVISGLKMAYDYWNSGEFAKNLASLKAVFGMQDFGPQGVADMEESLKGTEAFRKIEADYAIKKPVELKQEFEKELFDWRKGQVMSLFEYEQNLMKEAVQYEIDLQKDALQFQLNQQTQTLDAELDRRKAISAAGINGASKYLTLSERALLAVGSSAKQIIEAVGKFSIALGTTTKDSFKLAQNAAGVGYRLGGSADDVLEMVGLFKSMDNISADMASNLVNGITKFANLNDVAPQAVFNQIKESGEDIYKYTNLTTKALVKQAVALTKMGVSMSSMLKATESMVLNYKDSIKAEMRLGALMGRSVDLSEVRARLAMGETDMAAEALRSALGGVDMQSLTVFQKQALTEATGMDMKSLMNLMQGGTGEVKDELTAEKEAGKVIANSALQQDIANAGAKLALEQQQRKKLLQFEQDQRLAMLFLEHAQKLDQIKVEAAFRRKWELEYGKRQQMESLAVDALAESATNAFAYAAGATKGDLRKRYEGQYSDPAELEKRVNTEYGKMYQTFKTLATLQESGRISSADVADITAELKGVISQSRGKDVGTAVQDFMNKKFSGQLVQYNKDQERYAQRIQNIANVLVTGKKLDIDEFIDVYKVTKDERKLAESLLKKEQRTTTYAAGNYGATNTITTSQFVGLDQKLFDDFKRGLMLGGIGGLGGTTGGVPSYGPTPAPIGGGTTFTGFPYGVLPAPIAPTFGTAGSPGPKVEAAKSEVVIPTAESILTEIADNDHARGIVMFKEMQLQTKNDDLRGKFTLNEMKLASSQQLTMQNKMRFLQEAMVELLGQLVQKSGGTPTLVLDGKVLSKNINAVTAIDTIVKSI